MPWIVSHTESSKPLSWRRLNVRDDLVTEIAFDGPRAFVRQRSVPQLTANALDFNSQLRNHADPYKGSRGKEMRHEAHLTPAVIMWLRAHKGIDVFNPDHMPGLRRILNDPEFRALRVSSGGF